VQDHLGSVRQLVTTGGTVAVQYDYDPYGARTTLSGSADSDIGYAGYFHHALSGLDFTIYRAYDAADARWLNRDPIGEAGGFNLYAYVEGQPISATDPFGLAPCPIDVNKLVEEAKKAIIDPKTKKPNTGKGGNCALTVRGVVQRAGGPKLPSLGDHGTPTHKSWGAALIDTGCYKSVTDPQYKAKPGDIAITEGKGTGHISVYDGQTWDADIPTKNAVPNSGGKYEGAKAGIYQYVGP
jgi:RHS repeat-associated protein